MQEKSKEYQEDWNNINRRDENIEIDGVLNDNQKERYHSHSKKEKNDDPEAILTNTLEETLSANNCNIEQSKTVNDVTSKSNSNKILNHNSNSNNNTSTDSLECYSEKYVDCTEDGSDESDNVSMQVKLPSMENAILTKYIYTQAANLAHKVLKYGHYVVKNANVTDEQGAKSNNSTNMEHDNNDENECCSTTKSVINNDIDVSKKNDNEAGMEDLYKNEEEQVVVASAKEKIELECINIDDDKNEEPFAQCDKKVEDADDFEDEAAKLDNNWFSVCNKNADRCNNVKKFNECANEECVDSKVDNIENNENKEAPEYAMERNEELNRSWAISSSDIHERKQRKLKQQADIHAKESFVEEYTEEKERNAREAAIDAEVQISRFEFAHDTVEMLTDDPVHSNLCMFYDILMERELISSTVETNTTKSTDNHESDNNLHNGSASNCNYVNNNNVAFFDINAKKEEKEEEQGEQHEKQEKEESYENDRETKEDSEKASLSEIVQSLEFLEAKSVLQISWKDWRLANMCENESKLRTESTCTNNTKSIPVITIIISYNKERIYFDKNARMLISDELGELEISNTEDDSELPSKYRSSAGRQSKEISNLHECLVNAAVPDRLTGDNAWYCSRCQVHRDALTQRKIFRLPPCLLISFKRFKHTAYRNDKNDTVVNFPTTLDARPYLDPAADHSLELTQYRLKGVVYHCGSLSYGHYTAIAFNDSIGRWVLYNDSNTTVLDIDEPKTKDAYILWYERIQPKAIKADSLPEN